MKPWQLTHNGKTWRDMPGETNDLKKLNFFLFRRGLFNPDAWRDKLFPNFKNTPSKEVIEGRRVAKADQIATEIELQQQA